jgi:hypothetical protein
VLGERIDPPVLAEVTGLPAAEVAALLDQAVAQVVADCSGSVCMRE